ncbi:hypothetical protein PtrSN002B_006868 [Pyrenophora tritici-repentis]|uniref:Uncharacterized protein n=1 Tax=Pyrenophora tritici-repentis TaxID=45151 RepID=A0A2W1DWF9_9PLEO|nr:hypothetical protein A1F99_088140 [Pyrenophora tritici-repentis]KAF7569732.1 hypothetical protein PtrM4_121470 [Pyrenophora tritici-repentis]KAI1533755.1 hypothetical protein PtrSN001A_006702 [Pyrenophora tritici-repentis]KAI1537068.1 hypothetical protein PtrSN001C_006268 [Pyrenophora tritici-repentis]KAI1546951.1 hypothetical protein PtrSN002B_006868 [Pyrenophora tritici-repentis]
MSKPEEISQTPLQQDDSDGKASGTSVDDGDGDGDGTRDEPKDESNSYIVGLLNLKQFAILEKSQR